MTTCLLVDDEELRELTGQRLAGYGMRVLLDLQLPDGEGIEVCREMRVNMNVPVIMLTASVGPVSRILGLEMGADDHELTPYAADFSISPPDAILPFPATPFIRSTPVGRAELRWRNIGGEKRDASTLISRTGYGSAKTSIAEKICSLHRNTRLVFDYLRMTKNSNRNSSFVAS